MKFLLFASLLRSDFIYYKHRFNLHELVQVHHIIPQEWKNHDCLLNYDIHSGYNLIFMPTNKGKDILFTKRRIHDGGHLMYNKYIKMRLDSGDDPFILTEEIRKKIITGEDIAW